MFELVSIERGGRKGVWDINLLAKREVLYYGIANCGEYCIYCNIYRIRMNAAGGG